jgi:hypothetical protein
VTVVYHPATMHRPNVPRVLLNRRMPLWGIGSRIRCRCWDGRGGTNILEDTQGIDDGDIKGLAFEYMSYEIVDYGTEFGGCD